MNQYKVDANESNKNVEEIFAKISGGLDFENFIKNMSLEDFVSFQQSVNTIKSKLDEHGQGLKAEVYFSECAYYKMKALIDGTSDEVAWDGIVERRAGSPNVFDVTDVIVYPQKVTGATVVTDDVLYINWLNSLSDEQFNKRRFNGHSHVNMAVSPSTTDMSYREDSLRNIKDFFIFGIFNKKNDVNLEIYDIENNIYYGDQDIVYYIPVPDYKEWAAGEMKAKVTKQAYSWQNGQYQKTQYGTVGANTQSVNYTDTKKNTNEAKVTGTSNAGVNTISDDSYDEECDDYYERLYGKCWRNEMRRWR